MSTHSFTHVKKMIEQDLAISRQLLSLLEQEKLTTQKRDFDQLKTIVEEKVHLLDNLESHAKTRSDWLSSLNQAATEENWSHFINNLGIPVLKEQWQEVTGNLNRCQQVNEINGKLLVRNRQIYSQLLQLLRGNIEPTSLYTAGGNKHTTTTSKTVIRA